MMRGAEPDFRTISDFRKDNIDSMKEIFHEFNRRISSAVDWGFCSIDGSKFQANNSKDNHFTKNKLDDRIKWLNAHTDEYLRLLKEIDEQEELEEMPENLTQEVIEGKLKEAHAWLSGIKAIDTFQNASIQFAVYQSLHRMGGWMCNFIRFVNCLGTYMHLENS